MDLPHLAFLHQPSGDPAIDADLKYIRNLNWAETSLGRIESWAPELLILISLAMLSPQPQLFLLGSDSIILYNTAYGALLRDHHPLYQCRPIGLNEALVAQAPVISRIVGNAETKSKPANENYVPFFFLNGGRLEEVFLSATMVQLPQPLSGFHATTYDTTTAAVQLRRDRLLEQIISKTSSATNLAEVWSAILSSIGVVDDEFGFAVLYRARAELQQDPETQTTQRIISSDCFYLAGTVGDFPKSPPSQIELSGTDKWIVSLRETVSTHRPAVLRAEDGTLPEMFQKASCGRCYGDGSHEAIVLPNILTDEGVIPGLLILGLHPRRPLDDSHMSWIQTLHRNIANIVTSSKIAEAEALAKENDLKRAAQQREMFVKELRVQEQEAVLATTRIQTMLRIMQSANVGVFECRQDGSIIEANQAFSTMSGCRMDLNTEPYPNILQLCDASSITAVKSGWDDLMAGQSRTFTLNFKREGQESIWVQAACMPVHSEGGGTKTITGCATDVTANKNIEREAIKRAEALEKLRHSEARLLEEAIEARRQQENFVDMTSHEIRNPLSAVFHCSDAIHEALEEMKSVITTTDTSAEVPTNQHSSTKILQKIHQEILENAMTISTCAMHQKRITDDILMLSKLDSNLLEISPSVFNADAFLNQVYTTFSNEANREGVMLKVVQDKSMSMHSTPWIQADPGRITQVMVNLVSNGIKFTKDQTTGRTVEILMGASPRTSKDFMDGFIIPADSQPNRVALKGNKIFYLWFKVRDSGCGMDAAGRARIFSRFSQASPKTYSTYGGSGLGLFISKMLVNLQGGEIGFTSEESVGSTFAFYIEAGQVEPSRDGSMNTPNGVSKSINHAFLPDSKSLNSFSSSILLVEDNLINQKVLARQLKRLGFQVLVANDGYEALQCIKTSRLWKPTEPQGEDSPNIDIILMDVEMPNLDGIECTKMIRAAERQGLIERHIPIIAVTANARPDQLTKAHNVGMDDAVSKPFHVGDLAVMIQRLTT